MAEVIAGLYELEEEIGAGGGGVVYLGRHIRLDKRVVLKADKRTLKAGKDALRREVDMLKGLSHTYIPQVYDFVEENGVVYTVMDFIGGESFDKILSREGKQEQSLAIKWACQLLEAVSYLHRQGEYGILHGDIKPANIMLKPDGDICLIDFNIALALGEDGAVKVGFSRGYASPEHYGAEYIEGKADTVSSSGFSLQKLVRRTSTYSDVTEVDEDSKKLIHESETGGMTGKRKKVILLDARSDIYSLGATLYHIFSGEKPAPKASEVAPLSEKICNPLIATILKKAMSPNPADRYSTAEEMLEAFLSLRKNDRRVIRRRKKIVAATASLSILFLLGGSMTMLGLKQRESRKEALALSAYSLEAKKKGDIEGAITNALRAVPRGNSIFEAPLAPEARRALAEALGVYELSDGFHDEGKEALPSAPFRMIASPSGKRFALLYGYEIKVYSGKEVKAVLPLMDSAFASAVFLDDETLLYAAPDGITSFSLSENKENWKGEKATGIVLSGDKKVVAAVYLDAHEAIIYDASSGKVMKRCDFDKNHLPVPVNDKFADTMQYIFSLNEDGSLLAVSFEKGGVSLFHLKDGDEEARIIEESDAKAFYGCFYKDNFAFSTWNGETSSVYFLDIKELTKIQVLGSMEEKNKIMIRPTEDGLLIVNGGKLTKLEPESRTELLLADLKDKKIKDFAVNKRYSLILSEEDEVLFFDEAAKLLQTYEKKERVDFALLLEEGAILSNRDDASFQVLSLEHSKDKEILSYNSEHLHDEARVSEAEDRAILFQSDRFYLYDLSGKLLLEKEFEDSKSIYDQQFIRDEKGSYLKVIWYDGSVKHFSIKDGEVIHEEKIEKPDKELIEEFVTSKYKIKSSLHEAPSVYDVKNGDLVKKMETEDHLTYVSEVKEGLILEFVTADGFRYGNLYDENFNVIAYLPYLSDVYEDKLIFDYKNGHLKLSPIYSVQELIEMGNKRIGNEKEMK